MYKALDLLNLKVGHENLFIYILQVIREAPWPDMDPPWINRKYFANDFFNWTWTYRNEPKFFEALFFNFGPKPIHIHTYINYLGPKYVKNISSLEIEYI